MATEVETLARGWIEAWIRFDMDWLREHLSDDFAHTRPFGRLEGREHYLGVVEPMARKSVSELKIRDVVIAEDRAALWFENHTGGAIIDTCDWVFVEDGQIRKIRSFYDPAAVRDALPTSDQEQLEGY